ncbi:tissue inhibitor of metalloproteinase [Anthonomus grandis grandis]|uniref:tissue inhibitor of metalloproteinase n=1 Tax=Anthonomus grandis grandis TaxID=2921223 RepID=UPI0021650297|nr:tissue inhibitor of metalloproteinase [Anthonomus grandis grandis]XP_050304636.1 tissue inhibitor of metalloproteinase [Anthonomus grandis grandis]
MKAKFLTISLALLLGSISVCNACSCMRTHPQEHYCRSDFVILARVKKVQTIDTTGTNVYKVRVRREFKISEKGLVALKSGRIHTPSSDSMCGANLNIGELYVISGNIYSLRAHTNSCFMVEPWNNVPKRRRKYLRGLYKHGCTCKIDRYKTTGNKNSCTWTFPLQCEEDEGVCLRQASGACRWNKNRALTECKFRHQRPTVQIKSLTTNSTSFGRHFVPLSLIP